MKLVGIERHTYTLVMESEGTPVRVKPLLIVTGGIVLAIALLALAGEEALIFLSALGILFGASAILSRSFGPRSTAGRVVANALIATIAGGVPGLAFLATIEGDGLGGLAGVAATVLGAGLGLVIGAIAGACGIGLRTISNRGLAKVFAGACLGALLAASAGWVIIGIGNELKVIAVLVLSVAGLFAGMFFATER